MKLYIAEKPSLGRAIADVLPKPHRKQQGYIEVGNGASFGITASASDTEVKKAYRRLMNQHHPDKLMSKGLPPEMLKMATQKTQQIKSAYEQIRKARML